MNKTKLISVNAVSSLYQSIFGEVGEAADVDGKVLAQLRYIGEAVDGLEGAVNIPNVEYKSPRDFTATYTSSATITLSGLPDTFYSADIAYILCIPSGGSGAFLLLNGHDGITMTISSNVITVNGSDDTFASGDTYLVGLNGQEKGYDSSTNSIMNSDLNPLWSRYTDGETLVSEQDLTAAYADFGAEIDMQGYNRLGIFIVADCNDSEGVDLKLLGKHESGGSDEYEIDGIAVETLWSGAGTDFKKYYEFDIGTIPYIQLQAIAGTLGATAGDLSIVINKKWRN